MSEFSRLCTLGGDQAASALLRGVENRERPDSNCSAEQMREEAAALHALGDRMNRAAEQRQRRDRG